MIPGCVSSTPELIDTVIFHWGLETLPNDRLAGRLPQKRREVRP